MEVVEARHLKKGGELVRYLRELNGEDPPQEGEVRAKEYKSDPSVRKEEVDGWSSEVASGVRETERAIELVRERDRLGLHDPETKLFWNQVEQWHALLYVGLFTFIPVAWSVYNIVSIYEGGELRLSTMFWGLLLFGLFGLLVRWMLGMWRFTREFWYVEVGLEPETTFCIIAGVLRANSIEYELIHDPAKMPSRRMGQSYRRVSFHIHLVSGDRYLDVAGNTSTMLWFGPIPESTDDTFEKLLVDLNETVRAELRDA